MFKNIIFDWSGTLVDDLALTLDASNYVFSQYGKPCMNRDEFRAEFSFPIRTIMPGCCPTRIWMNWKTISGTPSAFPMLRWKCCRMPGNSWVLPRARRALLYSYQRGRQGV